MKTEKRKVLDMLASGKITPDEAEQLLNRLASPGKRHEAAEGEVSQPADDEIVKNPKSLRYLRVVVDKPNRDKVNVRLPLKLVRTGLKLSALMPGKAGMHFSDQDIDLSYLGKLKGEALDNALAELDINIETDKGEKVRVFCE